MKKRLLSMALCLCMVLTLLPTAALAADSTSVMMGSTTLKTGNYIPAGDSTPADGPSASIRVVDEVDGIPNDGNYLHYDASSGA